MTRPLSGVEHALRSFPMELSGQSPSSFSMRTPLALRHVFPSHASLREFSQKSVCFLLNYKMATITRRMARGMATFGANGRKFFIGGNFKANPATQADAAVRRNVAA